MFNIRVYGILINEDMQVLVSDELIRGSRITKFCGGGLEAGEGAIECLKREFLEEMNLAIEVKDHFYTTDFYQQSAFNPAHQIISIYYLVTALEEISVPLRNTAFDFDEQQLAVYRETGETETFRFVDWNNFSEETVNLPIDKIVAGLIKKNPGMVMKAKGGFPFTPFILENERARLEPLAEKHFKELLPIAMEREIWEFTSADIRTEADFRDYFDKAIREREAGVSCPYAIFDKQYNGYAGCTRFGNISLPDKRVEIGWTWYKPSLQRSGINKATKYLMLDYGFDKLQLNRIELKTSLKNIKSQGAMLKIGAVKEGILRKHMIAQNGTVRDTVYFSFISEEWPETRNTIFSEFS